MPGFCGFKQLLWTSKDFYIKFGEIITYHSIGICARSQYWVMLGRLGFSLFQLKLSIIYTDNFCLVSLSYVERDNKKRKQNMFPFDFFCN